MSPVRIWEAGLLYKCPGSVAAYHDCLSRNRLGFEFRPGRNSVLYQIHNNFYQYHLIIFNSAVRNVPDPVLGPGIKKRSAGRCRRDQEASPRREPEHDLAAGLPPVKVSLGEEDPDTGPDTALAVAGIQRLDNLADMAALLVRDGPEDVEMGRSRHKNFRCFKGDCFHRGFFHGVSW